MDFKQCNVLIYTCVPYIGHEKYGGAITVAWDTVSILQKMGLQVVTAYYEGWNGWGGDKLNFEINGKLMDIDLSSAIKKYDIKVALLCDILSKKFNRVLVNAKIPIIQEIHGPCFPSTIKHRLQIPLHKRWKEYIWELRHRYMCRFSSLVTRPSKFAAATVIENYGVKPAKVRVIYNSVNLDLFKPSDRQITEGSNEKCVFINAGRMAPNRNFLECIQVFEKILKEFPTCELLLAGDGYQLELCREYVRNRSVKNVTFLGSVSRKQLANYFRSADVLLNTSEYETFGCVLAEAMASGLPIISYDTTAIPEIAPNEVVGYLNSYITNESW